MDFGLYNLISFSLSVYSCSFTQKAWLSLFNAENCSIIAMIYVFYSHIHVLNLSWLWSDFFLFTAKILLLTRLTIWPWHLSRKFKHIRLIRGFVQFDRALFKYFHLDQESIGIYFTFTLTNIFFFLHWVFGGVGSVHADCMLNVHI